MSGHTLPDAIVLVSHSHPDWQIDGCRSPLFVCSEMFVALNDIEVQRWRLWTLRDGLRAGGYAVATLADFLVAEDIAWLETQGARVAHEWYCDDAGDDPTMYRGISLGRCIEYDVKARAIRLLKLARCIERVRQRYPGVSIFTDSGPESIERDVLARLDIDVRHFGHPWSVDVSTLSSSAPAAGPSLKVRVLETARHTSLAAVRWASRLTARRQPPGTPRVVVRVGLQSVMMLQRWLTNPSRGIHFVLWMSYLMRPNSVLRLVQAGHSITEQTRAPTRPEYLASVRARVERLFGLPNRHPGAGRPMGSLLDAMLGQVSSKTFPIVHAAIDDAYAELGHPDTALLCIPNDCQPLMRAWTLVAQVFGLPSLVLQHGYLDYTEDGDHLTATHSAFWSETVSQYYRTIGLRPEQVIVTGSPNADLYVKRQLTETRGTAVRTADRPRILIITTGNPGVQAYIHETWVCDYVAGILDALKLRFADFTFAMKLHPGECAALYREHLADRLPPGMEISDRGDLARMIAEADIIISPPSTVVIEARAGGKAVILMPVPTVEHRRTTLSEVEGVVTVYRNEDLVATIDSMMACMPGLPTGQWPLEWFLGPLDGGSSGRLLEAVEMLALEPRAVVPAAQPSSLEKSHAFR